MTAIAAEVRIKSVAKDDAGVWRAVLALGRRIINVDRRFGSWRITPATDVGPYTLLHPDVSALIQARVYPLERKAAKVRAEQAMYNTTTKENDMPATTTPTKQKDDAKKASAAKNSKTKAKSTTTKPAGKPRGEEQYKAAIAATPKGEAKAINANAIAAVLSEKRGKKVWPMPTKAHLEKAVEAGAVKKVDKDGRTLYFRP